MKTFILTCLFWALLSLAVYLTAIISIHGIRKSVSDSNYFLKKPFKLMFELVMWTCGAAIMLSGIFIKGSIVWEAVIGGLGIFLVGIFSDFKRTPYTRLAHCASAIGGFALLGVSFWSGFGQAWYTAFMGISAIAAAVVGKKRIWCLELTMAGFVFFGLYWNAIKLL